MDIRILSSRLDVNGGTINIVDRPANKRGIS